MIKIYFKSVVFKEIAQSLHQQLSLKYSCVLVDTIDETDDNVHILFGAHELICEPPPNFIVYQLEQTAVRKSKICLEYLQILERAKFIWDYSEENIRFFNHSSLITRLVEHVPIFYSPILEKCSLKTEKDIDVLFFGSKCARRENIYSLLEKTDLRVQFHWNSIWGNDRDQLISRSKIVLNLHYYDNAILETPRITYLLANRATVISEPGRNSNLNDMYSSYIHFANTPAEIVELCIKVCQQKEERKSRYRKAYQWFRTQTLILPKRCVQLFEPYTLVHTSRKKRKRKHKTYIPSLLKPAETRHNVETGEFSLILNPYTDDELPFVSIVTPTFNRKKLFPIAIRNWKNTIYPPEKLEWIIMDDGQEDLIDILPEDSRIKYIRITENPHLLPLSMGEKRNRSVSAATHPYIMFMDDDDHYFPEHVLSRVKVLLTYNVGCVGCSAIGSYDMNTHKSSFITNGPMYSTESTLGFTREFWKERSFHRLDRSGEYKKFLQYRDADMRTIPFQFVSIAFTHSQNTTSGRNVNVSKGKYDLFREVLDKNTQIFYSSVFNKCLK